MCSSDKTPLVFRASRGTSESPAAPNGKLVQFERLPIRVLHSTDPAEDRLWRCRFSSADSSLFEVSPLGSESEDPGYITLSFGTYDGLEVTANIWSPTLPTLERFALHVWQRLGVIVSFVSSDEIDEADDEID